MTRKESLIKKFKLKDNINIKVMQTWQIEKSIYFLSKGKKKITPGAMRRLIMAERKIKSFYINWSLTIESKIKALLESSLNSIGKKNSLHTAIFYSKNYINNKLPKDLKRRLVNAINHLRKNDKKTYEYAMKISGESGVDYSFYIKYLYFSDIIYILKNLKFKLQKYILDILKIDKKYIVCINMINELRNYSAHDNSILDYMSLSFALPRNIITSALSKFIHKSQKYNGVQNKNLLAQLICFKYLLDDFEFEKFVIGFREVAPMVSRSLGANNIIYYRLFGGNMKMLDKLLNIKSKNLMSFDKYIDFSLVELREEYKATTGNYVHFKSRYEALDTIVFMFHK